MTQNSKVLDKKNQKGLSLIESAMVLALAATVTAGVMFYYQSASDSNKTQAAISEVMSATSAINGLYVGQPNYNGLKADVLLNSSAIPDNYKDKTGKKITNPFGGDLTVAPATNNTQYGYSLTLTGLPKSACISLGTLNLGTSAAGYAIDKNGSTTPAFPANGSGPISPANAATQCTGDSNSVAYFMK